MDPRGLAAAESIVCWASIGAASSSYLGDGYLGCFGPNGYGAIDEPHPRPNGAVAIHAGEVFWARYDGTIAAAAVTGGRVASS